MSQSNNYLSNIDKATEIIFYKLNSIIDESKIMLKEWRFEPLSKNLNHAESVDDGNETSSVESASIDIPFALRNKDESTSTSPSKFNSLINKKSLEFVSDKQNNISTSGLLECKECGIIFRLQINLKAHKLSHKHLN